MSCLGFVNWSLQTLQSVRVLPKITRAPEGVKKTLLIALFLQWAVSRLLRGGGGGGMGVFVVPLRG